MVRPQPANTGSTPPPPSISYQNFVVCVCTLLSLTSCLPCPYFFVLLISVVFFFRILVSPFSNSLTVISTILLIARFYIIIASPNTEPRPLTYKTNHHPPPSPRDLYFKMPSGVAPGANSRGRGGKFRKFTRGGKLANKTTGRGNNALLSPPLCKRLHPKLINGPVPLLLLGGKHFSRDLRPLDADGNEISMWSVDAQQRNGNEEEDDDDEEEDSSEEESEDDDAPKPGELSREERKAEKKARKDAAIAKAKGLAVQVGDLPPNSDSEGSDDDDMPANPNHSKAARKQTKASAVDEATDGVRSLAVGGGTPSRRERESIEAQQAKERYRKLHEQGKTDEAKADMARLKVIREKREAEAARKQVFAPFFFCSSSPPIYTGS